MAMTLITTNTSSNAASSSFTSSIDSTYKLYIFKFINVNPATNTTDLGVQFNAAGASGYNETMTTSVWRADHLEDDSVYAGEIDYRAAQDQAQGTAFQSIAEDVGNGGDESASGTLWLFNPSNTTYVKHFYSRLAYYGAGDSTVDWYVGGYINTTTAIDDVQFKMSSGNMDGIIKMYGVG